MTKSTSTEQLLRSVNTSACPTKLVEILERNVKTKSIFGWASGRTKTVLKYQLGAICILTWLIIELYASNLRVKTQLTTEFAPLWSLWIVAVYALSISIAFSFHYFPSKLGILISGILEVINLIFSSFFIFLALSALTTHSNLDNNNDTRMFASVLYTSTVMANVGISLTSLLLILSSASDLINTRPHHHLIEFSQTYA